MKPTVYGAALSPFVRKVRVLLAEKGLEYQLEMILPFNQPDWFKALSPLNRIPAFKDGDFTIADSTVICEYIEERYSDQPSLRGNGPEARARVRWLEKYADYEVAPLATFAIFQNRIVKPTAGKPCDEAAVQRALNDKLPIHLDYLESALGDAQYFVADSLSMADLAIACQLINMRHAGEELDASRWPALSALLARLCARESFISVLPGEEKMLAAMARKR